MIASAPSANCRFLALEGTANDLVDDLNALKEQVSKYMEASDSRAVGAEALARVAGKLTTVAESMGQVMRDAVAAGIPEVLTQLDSLALDNRTLSQGVKKTKLLVITGLAGVMILSFATLIVGLIRLI
jgi:hypothetical protein